MHVELKTTSTIFICGTVPNRQIELRTLTLYVGSIAVGGGGGRSEIKVARHYRDMGDGPEGRVVGETGHLL